tara:strand:+ start:315 stop:563 length:249 start_codon:yes stop_codon:yes gene_type:complete
MMNRDKQFKDILIQALSGADNGVSEEKIREMYIDWFNNFYTVARFSEYYDIADLNVARAIINSGRTMHEEYCLKQHEQRIER